MRTLYEQNDHEYVIGTVSVQKGKLEKRQITCPFFESASPRAQCNLNKYHVITLSVKEV